MDDRTDHIEREIVAERYQVGRNLNDLERKAKQLTGWRTYYRHNPKLLLGIALGGGLALGAIAARGRRPSRDDDSCETGGCLQRPGGRSSRQFGAAWQGISDALIGFASAQATEFASRVASRPSEQHPHRPLASGNDRPMSGVLRSGSSDGKAASTHAAGSRLGSVGDSIGQLGGHRVVAANARTVTPDARPPSSESIFVVAPRLIKQTAEEWIADKAPQLGAALAYYTVFSLAPLILLITAIIGFLFRDDPSGAWTNITEQMSHLLDKSAVDVIQGIAKEASQPGKGALATVVGVGLALLGAAGVFVQLQVALNTIWGMKAKPGLGIWGFIRARIISLGMVGGICFLLLVSLVIEILLKGFSHWVQAMLPGGLAVAVSIYLVFDFSVVVVLFAMIFKFLPDAEIRWRDVWAGSFLTAFLFLVGKWALGLYLGGGAAASAYGAASSLITLLLWIYYSSQILLFGAEFTQVYATYSGAQIKPNKYGVAVNVC